MGVTNVKRPLEGIKVLDFTIALAGVYTAWQLADLGAEVWKVERYGSGDQTRVWDPYVNDMSLLYATYNKNKKSIEVDLRPEEGKKIILDMVKKVDIVVENFKSGSLERLGLDYEALKQANPNIVFLSLSGFGQTGPLSELPCYDAIAAARSGFAASNGDIDGSPMKPANANCDTLTGTHALNAILMGIYQARKTGEGSYIDIAMVDTAMIAVGETTVDYYNDKYEGPRFGNHDRFIAPYGLFEARDGWAAIIADTEERWENLCDAFGLEELKNDPKFKDNESRVENKDELVEKLEAVTITYKREEIENMLLEVGVPASEVLPFIEAYTSDHSNATSATEFVNQEKIGHMRFYNSGIRFNDEITHVKSGAPLLGADSRDVLKEVGYTEDEIEALIEENVLGESLI